MSGIPPILYSEGRGLWSRIERALGSGGPVELIIPHGGSYDALKVGDHVLRLPRMVDIEEGSTLVIKLGEQGMLELIKILPPVPSTKLLAQSPEIGLDQIDSELMAKLFEILFGVLDDQLSESKLPLLPTQTQIRSLVLQASPGLTPTDIGNPNLLEKAIKLILNEPETVSKLITTFKNEVMSLKDDEFMTRLLGNNMGEKAPVIELGMLLKMSIEVIDKTEDETNELFLPENISGRHVKLDAGLLRALIKELAVEIGKDGFFRASSGDSILDILKAAIIWLQNQRLSLPDQSITHFVSKFGALIEPSIPLNFEILKSLITEIQLFGRSLTNNELPLLNNFASPYPKALKVVSLIERFFTQLQESIEWSSEDVIRKKTRGARVAKEFTELSPVETRNRLLEQCCVLERLNTSLFLDGRLLFCLPFSVGKNLESVFGELQSGDNEEEGDSESSAREVRPDIRFEVDFRNLGHVLGLIFVRRKRIMLFFENEEALSLCSGQLRLLSVYLGEEWVVDFDLKARHLHKKITA